MRGVLTPIVSLMCVLVWQASPAAASNRSDFREIWEKREVELRSDADAAHAKAKAAGEANTDAGTLAMMEGFQTANESLGRAEFLARFLAQWRQKPKIPILFMWMETEGQRISNELRNVGQRRQILFEAKNDPPAYFKAVAEEQMLTGELREFNQVVRNLDAFLAIEQINLEQRQRIGRALGAFGAALQAQQRPPVVTTCRQIFDGTTVQCTTP